MITPGPGCAVWPSAVIIRLPSSPGPGKPVSKQLREDTAHVHAFTEPT